MQTEKKEATTYHTPRIMDEALADYVRADTNVGEKRTIDIQSRLSNRNGSLRAATAKLTHRASAEVTDYGVNNSKTMAQSKDLSEGTR